MNSSASPFDEHFRAKLNDLFAKRRDVRRFRRDQLPAGMLEDLVRVACMAPSVGFSQPWRWVQVNNPERRAGIIENFRLCNENALNHFVGERAGLYGRLKLAGLVEAPVHLAVFVDTETDTGHGLGVKTMPEMLPYSAICAVHTLWLAARAQGVGLGWVSILDPAQVCRTLDVSATWKLIAYLCLGYPEEELNRPELEIEGWELRQPAGEMLLSR